MDDGDVQRLSQVRLRCFQSWCDSGDLAFSPGWRWEGIVRWRYPSWSWHLHVWRWESQCGTTEGERTWWMNPGPPYPSPSSPWALMWGSCPCSGAEVTQRPKPFWMLPRPWYHSQWSLLDSVQPCQAPRIPGALSTGGPRAPEGSWA